MASDLTPGLTPFLLLSPRLVILPTPFALCHAEYLSMYTALHASADFCEMGFGPDWGPRQWTDAQVREVVQSEVTRSWLPRGVGDFAVGLRPDGGSADKSDVPRVVEGKDFEAMMAATTGKIEWCGYAGVRDATTTSMPAREPGDPVLPGWQEMVEIRYGVDPKFWGRGLAPEAAKAVMSWAASHRGVTRFIAETERPNARSGNILKKLGFSESGTNYWKEPMEIEWEMRVVPSNAS
ncbi:hypothetical protein PLICRDRAFT_172674 [Plicaturopsis crispa FD-325 SS-3]|nr:hypothetical protein PLICRDRAFT_172674 [Plicaturopsis crispa FD-325 SS-3]